MPDPHALCPVCGELVGPGGYVDKDLCRSCDYIMAADEVEELRRDRAAFLAQLTDCQTRLENAVDLLELIEGIGLSLGDRVQARLNAFFKP